MSSKTSSYTQLSAAEYDKMDAQKLQEEYYNLITINNYRCTNWKHFGQKGDGGWHVCMDSEFVLSNNDCLVYDFGISNVWGFDEQLAREYGCEVMCFDPSMNVKSHKHSAKVWFYNVGLSQFYWKKR